MFDQFTDSTRKAILLAKKMASDLGCQEVTTLHILHGVLSMEYCGACQILRNLGVNIAGMRHMAEAEEAKFVVERREQASMPLSELSDLAIKDAISEAKALDYNFVCTEHLFLGLMNRGGNSTIGHLLDSGITKHFFREQLKVSGGQQEQSKSIPPVCLPEQEPNPFLVYLAAWQACEDAAKHLAEAWEKVPEQYRNGMRSPAEFSNTTRNHS